MADCSQARAANVMRAVRLTATSGPADLRVEHVPDPTPKAGEVLVKLTHAALNRRDVFITKGMYPGIKLPCILGADGVGTVAALGLGVASTTVGTRVVIDPMLGWGPHERVWQTSANVLGMPADGTFAEYVVVPAINVHPAPANLSDAEAAAIPLAGTTAYRAVVTRGACTREDVVFIPGVGSGVQTFALTIAHHLGARTIVTSSSAEKLERARALGADVAINYKTSASWQKEVRAASDGGPSLVIDSVGGATFAACLDIARYAARVVTYGGTNGDATIRPYSIFWKQLDVLGSSMGSPRDFREMLALYASGLKPAIDTVEPLEDIAHAALRVDAGTQFGKVVLAIVP